MAALAWADPAGLLLKGGNCAKRIHGPCGHPEATQQEDPRAAGEEYPQNKQPDSSRVSSSLCDSTGETQAVTLTVRGAHRINDVVF